MKILIVEANEQEALFLKKGLTETGYTVEHANNGRDGMFMAVSESYDAIILEMGPPGGIDAFGIVVTLRKESNKTPIIVVSARSAVDDRIFGLKSGCDDYLVKPFSFCELLARLDAIHRRCHKTYARSELSIGDLHVDLLSRKVSRGGQSVVLQAREFKLLEYLIRHPNQVVTRTMLLENVWDYNFDPLSNVVDVHISKLRQKIDISSGEKILKTVRNAGYMLTDAQPSMPSIHIA